MRRTQPPMTRTINPYHPIKIETQFVDVNGVEDVILKYKITSMLEIG